MSGKKWKEAKQLEQRLKLCYYAYSCAVQPGCRMLGHRERNMSLQSLHVAGYLDINGPHGSHSLELSLEHTEASVAEILKLACHQELTKKETATMLELVSVWSCYQDEVPNWTVPTPAYASLAALLVDKANTELPGFATLLETKAEPETPETSANSRVDPKKGIEARFACYKFWRIVFHRRLAATTSLFRALSLQCG